MGSSVFAARLVVLSLMLWPLAARSDVLQVFDADGKAVSNAVISVPGSSTSNTGRIFAVDQVDKRFTPFVSVVPSGTLVSFPNSDDIRHHVYSFSDAKTFELRLYHANDAEPVLFDREGIVTLGCNVHDTMKAYVVVSDELAGVTDGSGTASLSDFAGVVSVWHPQLPTALELPVQNNVITLPVSISDRDPQAPRDAASLEDRFKRFRNNAP